MSKNKEIDRGLKGLGNQLAGAVKEAASVRIRITCRDCGGYKGLLDSSSCPHPGANDGQQFDHDVTINLQPSPPREQNVERVAREDEPNRIRANPRYSEKFKTPEADDPLKSPSLTNARARTDGGKSRRDYAGLQGPDDPFIQAQIRNYVDYEPGVGVESKEEQLSKLGGEPDVPEYRLEK